MIITLLKAASDSWTQFAPWAAKGHVPFRLSAAVIFLFVSIATLFIIGTVGGLIFGKKDRDRENEKRTL